MMTEEQFNKLPLYARMELEKLRTDVADLQRQAAQATGQVPSNLKAGHYREMYPLPEDWIVQFDLDPDKTITISLDPAGTHILVRTSNTRMFVLPVSANSVEVS